MRGDQRPQRCARLSAAVLLTPRLRRSHFGSFLPRCRNVQFANDRGGHGPRHPDMGTRQPRHGHAQITLAPARAGKDSVNNTYARHAGQGTCHDSVLPGPKMLVDMDYVRPQFGDQSRLGPNGAELCATGNCRQDPGLGPSPTAGDVSYDLCKGTDDGSLKRRPKASEKVTSDTLPPTYDWGIGVEKKSHLTPAPTAESGTSGFESSVRVARYAPGVARGISSFETRWSEGKTMARGSRARW